MRHVHLWCSALAAVSLLAFGCSSSPGNSTGGAGGISGAGGSGGSGGSGGAGGGGTGGDATGGTGGDTSGCFGSAPKCLNADCDCIVAECDVDTWVCPEDHPNQNDTCLKKSDCKLDTGAYGDCSAPKGDFARGPGGCCTTNADCQNAKFPNTFCYGGFCSANCMTTADCGDLGTPTPFAEGTKLYCQPTNILNGITGLCVPGSGAACSGPSDCPTAETCDQTWGAFDTGNSVGGFETHCIAKFVTPETKAFGAACAPVGAGNYQCDKPYLGLSTQYVPPPCLFGRCDASCNPASPHCPDGESCAPLGVNIPMVGTLAGAGVCTPTSCGTIDASVNEFRIDACPDGESCAPGFASSDTAFSLVCAPTRPDGVAFGAACQNDPALGRACVDTQFCRQKSAYVEDPGGDPCATSADCTAQSCIDTPDGTGMDDGIPHCSAPPADGICSKLCLNDKGCGGALPYCLLFPQPQGSARFAPECGVKTDVYARNLTCTKESDCKGAGQGCIQAGPGTALTICAVAHANESGAACSTDSNCKKGSVCAVAGDGQPHCTDVSGLFPEGTTCLTDLSCRSGACIDSEQLPPAPGRHDLCAGTCQFTTDCAAGMVCKPKITQGGDTPDPADDFAIGYCVPEGPPNITDSCRSADDCAGTGYDCDVVAGRCYRTDAKIGQSCTASINCPLHSECSVDGVCVQWGCDPSQRLPCPQPAVCVPQGPVNVCVRQG